MNISIDTAAGRTPAGVGGPGSGQPRQLPELPVIARALAPAEFGIYAVVFAVVLVLNTFHAALVAVPALDPRPGSGRRPLGALTSTALLGTSALSAILSCVAAIAVWTTGRPIADPVRGRGARLLAAAGDDADGVLLALPPARCASRGCAELSRPGGAAVRAVAIGHRSRRSRRSS